MTHLDPSGAARMAPHLLGFTIRTPFQRSLGIDGTRLRDAIAGRRARIAAIETAMVAACERVATRTASASVRLDDRDTWDKVMWGRYLTAAAAVEPDYLPEMLRLYSEVERLERLLALPMAQEAKAA